MLMTMADIEARTGQVYENEQIDRVQAYIDDITALIEAYLGRSFADSPAPAAVKAIACQEVIRYLNSEPGVSSDRVGDLSTAYAYSGAVVVLSQSAKQELRRWRARPGVGTLQLISHLSCGEEGDSP